MEVDEYIVVFNHPMEDSVWAYCETLEMARQTKAEFESDNEDRKFSIYRREE